MVEIGKSYHVYAKLPGKKRFRPMSGGSALAFNLIHADIFEIKNEADQRHFESYLRDLRELNPGRFEAREVGNW